MFAGHGLWCGQRKRQFGHAREPRRRPQGRIRRHQPRPKRHPAGRPDRRAPSAGKSAAARILAGRFSGVCRLERRKADIIRDNPKTATLKAVEAKYVSTGFVTKDDPSDESKTTEHTFPQSANLYLIASPDPAMTSVIRQRIESKIERSGFTRKDPLKFSNAASREEAPVIDRFLLVAQDESDPEIDLVYVAYVWNNDDLAIWAIEKEARRHIPGLDDISEQSGNRVGATLIALIEHQINQSK